MPLYEYECQACHFRFEKLQRLSDPPPKKCPECGGKVVQMMSTSSVQFKGSGWYVSDYQRKGSGGDSKSEKAESKGEKAESKGEKAESKPEAKSETKGGTKTESKSETRTKTETKTDSKGAQERK